ncbi:cation/H(+) antiporter 15-like [Telopea speciosissima]|uniref:cation/H(+) antiporter 15-like n=1 Tax=Telopea speciosissima TaxID=54955 RepID=UPI001CC39753|nr:cation/H(+) antiporter 15-like [Telopea speciosissima]
MAQHANVNLSVIRLIANGDDNKYIMNGMERMLDEDAITDFRLATIDNNDRVVYKEVGVTDGIGTINVLRSIDNSYDLILVGRRHNKDSPFLKGSAEWIEILELGFIADMLISTDFRRKVSILVVQQHDLASQAVSGFKDLLLPTPINSSQSWTFGFKSRLVKAQCIHLKRTGSCRGIFYREDPFDFIEPVFLMQLIAGFIAGPSALSRNPIIKNKLFPQPSKYVQETLSIIASIFIFFLAGVRMDIGTIKHSGKKEWAIGIFSFVIPMLFSLPTAFLFKRILSFNSLLHGSLFMVAFLMSSTSFNVVANFLYELKLLNSELGRLAMSSSMISVLLSWFSLDIGMIFKQTMMNGHGVNSGLMLFFSTVAMVFFMYSVLRPIMLWMIEQTEEGRPLKQSYLYSIFLMVLGCCWLSESLGKHVAFTAAFLGMCVPGGPPLGSALEEKVECFVTGVLLPFYLVVNFEDVDLYRIDLKAFLVIQSLCLIAAFGKFLGTVLTCSYFHVPLSESIPLGLVLCTLGLLDLQFYKSAQLLGYIDSPLFGVLSLSIIIVTGFVAPVVKVIYNPSRKYRSYKKRTLQHNKRHDELSILVCVYDHENVPALINLLEATNPIRDHPMAIYLLQLVELVGRAAPRLIPYQPDDHKINESQRSGRAIFNAFKIFERNNPGVNTMQAFISIAPYATMHDDICTLALDKRVCFIIVPFHKHIDEGVESVSRRNINQNVLMIAPCSVGILIDRGTMTSRRSILQSWVYFRVLMIFLGDADDREALSFAMRMAQHPNVNLSVIRLIATGDDNIYIMNGMERMLDEDAITDFRLATIDNSDRVVYKEVGVTDGIGTINVLRSIDNSYDLILVGRRHNKDSPFLKGSAEWIEILELGFIADMLISTDFKRKVSILVVQQHDLASQAVSSKHRLSHLYSCELP